MAVASVRGDLTGQGLDQAVIDIANTLEMRTGNYINLLDRDPREIAKRLRALLLEDETAADEPFIV